MELTLLTEYWDDPEARAAFKAFIREIHGLDFMAWEDAGYWDDRYTPFSYFEGDRVVSSMCAYVLDAVVDGERTKLVQISGVGTAPEYRRRGLNRELTRIGLAWARRFEPAGVFLFSNEDAIPFYRAQGFEAIEEYLEFLSGERLSTVRGVPSTVDGEWPQGTRRLDMQSPADRERVHALASRRAPVSERLAVLNAELFMFHCLYTMAGGVLEIPDLDCVVLARRRGSVLAIHDVVCERMPGWEELAPHLLLEGDREVEFHFATDRLGIEEPGRRAPRGNHPQVAPGWPVPDPVFPYTSRA